MGLTAATSYTYTAYPDATCGDVEELASETFTTTADNAPTVTGYNPQDATMNVAVDANLLLTFNEPVRKRTAPDNS